MLACFGDFVLSSFDDVLLLGETFFVDFFLGGETLLGETFFVDFFLGGEALFVFLDLFLPILSKRSQENPDDAGDNRSERVVDKSKRNEGGPLSTRKPVQLIKTMAGTPSAYR